MALSRAGVRVNKGAPMVSGAAAMAPKARFQAEDFGSLKPERNPCTNERAPAIDLMRAPKVKAFIEASC